MTRLHRGAPRALCLAAAAALACGKSEQKAASDSTARDVLPIASTPAAAASGKRLAASMPGALTKPIESYSGDELAELVGSLHFGGGHVRDRKCHKHTECSGGAAQKTSVKIEAVVEQDSVGAGNVPQYGVVHIKAVNNGKFEEARYGFQPVQGLEYYMILMRDGGQLHWRLEELDLRARPASHKQFQTGVVQDCGHKRWSAGGRTDFLSCAASEQASAAADSVVRLGLLLQGGAFDDPVWTMCDNGCCTLMP